MLFWVGYALALTVLSAAATRWVAGWLRARTVLDMPNDRSSHAVPTPRGGGIAVVVTLAVGATVVLLTRPDLSAGLARTVLLAALALAVLSWIDDLRGLRAGIRLLAHLGACAVGVWALPGPIFLGWLPGWADAVLAVLIWAGFLNFYNFMDGIDGITGVETVGIGLGLTAVALILPADSLPLAGPLALAATAAGFLVWNWAPARLFMGDVGSVPLGYLLGWFLLFVAAKGYWAPAVILPAYYLADAGLTLLRRAARREKFWHAHKEHFYQRAVARRLGAGRNRPIAHRQISGAIACINAVLIVLALGSLTAPVPALTASVVAVAGLLWWMVR